ncbi:MAG: hypothetical protein WKG00_09765 [Polyangiaceae bacterium]
MSGRRLTMVARLAVLVLAGGLAGCVVETVDEPEGEAELGLVAGGGDEAVAADVAADDAARAAEEVDDPEGQDLDLPSIYSTPAKGDDVSGDPSPDPWGPDPNPVNTDSESDEHATKTTEI